MIRRFIDIVISIGVLLLFSPMLIVISWLLYRRMGSVFFVQKRLGRDAVPFQIIKFKTMTGATDTFGQLLSDDQRLTSTGKWLRNTSLDELPTLINVIRGEMSLIGPRPLLPEYLPKYDAFQKRRMEIKPGITGWAQVNGRNSIPWLRKFELDVWYIDNGSLWLDIRIVWMTLVKVLKKEGIDDDGRVGMPPFGEGHMD